MTRGRRYQRGQAIVLIAIMLAVVVGMGALAIDGSRAYALRRDLQAAVDAGALAAGDNFQQTGSYASAEQAATTIFGANLRLYGSPSCSPSYASPGANPLTITCTFADGTVLTEVVSGVGAQGSDFRLTVARSLQLQFARILTNGSNPVINGAASGNVYIDPSSPPPAVVGGAQSVLGNSVILSPGSYAANPNFNSRTCWFLSGGVYEWQGGFTDSHDFVSNELKPPDEPDLSDNTSRSTHQFWDTNNVSCSGGVQVSTTAGPRGIPVGRWTFVVTATRTDTYGGRSYTRESAPSMCYEQAVNNSGQNVQIVVSNVPGATSYNIYAGPPNNRCAGPFGLVDTLPASGIPSNRDTRLWAAFRGSGCNRRPQAI